jgi:hypothetical protein
LNLTASGRAGELRIGGRVAAELGPWEVERGPKGWSGTLTAVNSNAVLLALPGPFEVRLTVGRKRWRWRAVTLTSDAPNLRMTANDDPSISEGDA